MGCQTLNLLIHGLGQRNQKLQSSIFYYLHLPTRLHCLISKLFCYLQESTEKKK